MWGSARPRRQLAAALLPLLVVACSTDTGARRGEPGTGRTHDPLLWVEQETLTASDPDPFGFFGGDVAISGDTALVGSPYDTHAAGESAGSSYVLVRTAGAWAEQQKLVASDASPNAELGVAVAIEGDTALVGAPGAGAAYVFVRTGATWAEQQRITGSDAAGARFGASVALHGDTAFVGAPSYNGSAGAVYVFVRAGELWSEQQTLFAADAGQEDRFGSALALDGDTALVGAWDKDELGMPDAGAAYVFVRSGATWAAEQKLGPGNAQAGDFFGDSVAVRGDTAIVGAPGDVENGVGIGSATVFVRSGTTWTEQQKLLPDAAEADASFGTSAALLGDTAVIGAEFEDQAGALDSGVAYVLVRSGGSWTTQQKLTGPASSYAYCGHAAALDGDTAVVGCPGAGLGFGSAPVFRVALELGEPCAQGDACHSGFCADGVCCDAACGGGDPGDCQACSAAAGAAIDGTCGPAAAETTCRAAGEACDVAEVCDGVTLACPADTVAANGTPCTGGVCAGGACVPSGDGGVEDDAGAYDDAGTSAASGGDPDEISEKSGEGGGCSVARSSATPGWLVAAIGWLLATWARRRAARPAAFASVPARFAALPALVVLAVACGSDAQDRLNAQVIGSNAGRSADAIVWLEQQKLTASDPSSDAWFGSSVAVSSDTAVVGSSNGGGVYAFARSGATWSEQQKLVSSDVGADSFDPAVAVSGDTAVVGFPDAGGAGAAYVFVRSGTTWSEQQKLTAGDGAGADRFGSAVAVSGDTILVGASGDDNAAGQDAGATYAFVRSGTTWTEQQKLVGSTASVDDELGFSVALSGDTAIVGGFAPGGAYVFVRAGATWTEQQKLTGPAADGFGHAVSISGDTAVVGLPDAAAYVFVRAGETWTEQQILTPDAAVPDTEFGMAVAVSGDLTIVTAYGEDGPAGPNAGVAYAFVRAGQTWTQQQKLAAGDGAEEDWFGWSVGLDGTTAIVGAFFDDDAGSFNAGSAYAFRLGSEPGEGCSDAAQCHSGFCVDGVCCDVACGASDPNDCEACSVAAGAAMDGACSPVPADTACRAAAGECDAPEVCDGASNLCPADTVAPNGTPCSGGACAGGQCVPGPDGGAGGGTSTSTGTGADTTGAGAAPGGDGDPDEGGGCSAGAAGVARAPAAWAIALIVLAAARLRARRRAGAARRSGILLGLALLASPRAVLAQSNDEAVAAALQKFEAGRQAYNEKRYAEALADLQASYKLFGSPNSRLYIARCHRELGRVASAYVNFRLTAREAHDRLAATGEKRYGATRDAANSEGAELEARVPRLVLAVPAGTPPGFVLKQNGAVIPEAAWGTAIETDPGKITIEATGHRVRPFTASLELSEGEQKRVEVRLERVPTATIALRFKARPAGIAVELDGAPIDASRFDRPLEVDVGARKIVARAPGHVPFRWEKPVEDGQRVEVPIDLAPDVRAAPASGLPRWMFFTAAGLSVASLGAATGVAVHAKGIAADETEKHPLLRDAEARDRVRAESTAANVLFIAGAAFGVGAGVLFFTTSWAQPSGSDAALSVSGGPALGGASLAASGRF